MDKDSTYPTFLEADIAIEVLAHDAKVMSKGQVTISKDVRSVLGVDALVSQMRAES